MQIQISWLLQKVITLPRSYLMESQIRLIQISWLLQKPTDLDLHCLPKQGISRFSRTRVNIPFWRIWPTWVDASLNLNMIITTAETWGRKGGQTHSCLEPFSSPFYLLPVDMFKNCWMWGIVEPDHIMPSVVSDLGLHCLHRPVSLNT